MENDEIVNEVRRLSGVAHGPDDKHILAAVRGFTQAFDYWYIRVIREAVPKYRNLIIKRINPFIRRIELDGKSSQEGAVHLVESYNNRNFVTAGGWALEEMAVNISPEAQKSSAEGIDIQRYDVSTGDYHLYVLKSGLVTRNSDIIKALKRNSRQAEKLLLQGQSTGTVRAKYAIVAGKTSSTFEDGIWRPSSAEFWAELTQLTEEDAIELALSVAAVAGTLVRKDATLHIGALTTLVADYIDDRAKSGMIDWDFLIKRTMRSKEIWADQDRSRHRRAMKALRSTGYTTT